MPKIKRNVDFRPSTLNLRLSHLTALFLLFLLVLTRFWNIGWGLPFPFHPDERNMADAVMRLQCDLRSLIFDLRSCFNPHFFAYGQFPLYLGYVLIKASQLITGFHPITFTEAVIALRFISALSSVITTILGLQIVRLLHKKESIAIDIISAFALIFSPGLIQMAHFGTTESLLTMLYTAMVYTALCLLEKKLSVANFCLWAGILGGIAVGTKVSAAFFLLVPIGLLMVYSRSRLQTLAFFSSIFLVTMFIASPHNILSFDEFMGSIQYESAVAQGLPVFYTQQFFLSTPIIFQFTKIFPYALGWPVFILSILGFIFLPRNKIYNMLRLALLIYFLPNAFLYTKWTRFMAPIVPFMIIFAIAYISHLSKRLACLLTVVMIVPGIAFLSIYTHPDIRFTANQWIAKNIPITSRVLSEGGNVVNIPNTLPFNFYDVDNDPRITGQLTEVMQAADYIIVPSRRVFMNFTCEMQGENILLDSVDRCKGLANRYPTINNYYKTLFHSSSFQKVATFSSYPNLSLFGHTLIEFPDEQAEETWSVFDHPVIRVFKKI